MTEKRFKLGYVCGDYGLIDNDEWIDLHSMSENSEKNVQICINKMNELSEENKELKQSISDWQGSYDELYEDNLKLEKENKELKKLIKKTLETTPMEHNLAVELKNNVREFYD